MLDFDTILTPMVETAPTVTEKVTVVRASAPGAYLAKEPALWNWTDLRDYLVFEIEQRHGPQVRDPNKEGGILKGFISRWGIESAVGIARAAMDVHGGMWRNAPITITRFCKGSDPYFAKVIAQNL